MARTKQTCRRRAKPKPKPIPTKLPRSHKRIASFIAAYEALCKSDIKPRSRFTALKGMMEKVISSYQKELLDFAHLHIGEEKNKGFRKNHDSDGDAGDGGAGCAGGSGARAGRASIVGFMTNELNAFNKIK